MRRAVSSSPSIMLKPPSPVMRDDRARRRGERRADARPAGRSRSRRSRGPARSRARPAWCRRAARPNAPAKPPSATRMPSAGMRRLSSPHEARHVTGRSLRGVALGDALAPCAPCARATSATYSARAGARGRAVGERLVQDPRGRRARRPRARPRAAMVRPISSATMSRWMSGLARRRHGVALGRDLAELAADDEQAVGLPRSASLAMRS